MVTAKNGSREQNNGPRVPQTYNERKYGDDGPAHAVGADNLTTPQHFAIGLAAGLIAKSATHPLDVIKKRFQVKGLGTLPKPP